MLHSFSSFLAIGREAFQACASSSIAFDANNESSAVVRDIGGAEQFSTQKHTFVTNGDMLGHRPLQDDRYSRENMLQQVKESFSVLHQTTCILAAARVIFTLQVLKFLYLFNFSVKLNLCIR